MQPDKIVHMNIEIPATVYLGLHYAAKDIGQTTAIYAAALICSGHHILNAKIRDLDLAAILSGSMCLWGMGFRPETIAQVVGITTKEAEKLAGIYRDKLWQLPETELADISPSQSEKSTCPHENTVFSRICTQLPITSGTTLEKIFRDLLTMDKIHKKEKSLELNIPSIDGHISNLRKKLTPHGVSVVSIDGCYAIPNHEKPILYALGERPHETDSQTDNQS